VKSLAALEISSFSVVEFKYASSASWYYAPLITVRELNGLSSATVISISVVIPGFFGASPAMSTNKCVAAGATQPLLHEQYGDYELTIDDGMRRSSGGMADVIVTYRDALGQQATATAKGSIVSGSLPTTYSSSAVTWTCGS